MKKSPFLMCSFLSVGLFVTGACIAQEAVKPSNCFYFGGGVETDNQPGDHRVYATYGTALRIVDLGEKTSLWNFSSINAGKYGSVATDIGLAIGLTPTFGVGILAGPNIDWITNVPIGGESPTVYLSTATGGFVTYDFTETLGVWAMGKYKFSPESGNLYPSGSVAGAGLLVRF